jgi:hypothetical protein
MILFSGREIALPRFRENDRLISRCSLAQGDKCESNLPAGYPRRFLDRAYALRNGFRLLTLDDRLYRAALPRRAVDRASPPK